MPQAVEPGQGVHGAATPVFIRGASFSLGIRVSYIDDSRSYVRANFIARLGGVDLLDVRWVDHDTLTAVVPPTLGLGVHDLSVVDPEGRTGSLAAAFSVATCLSDDDCVDDCHSADVCRDGGCVPGAVDCQRCSDDEPCDDGDPCTVGDTCQTGACLGGNPVVCTAADQCHDPGVCDPLTGLCSDPVRPVVCGDGFACGAEVCDDGTNDGCLGSCGQDCLAGPPVALAFLTQPSDAVAGEAITPPVSVVIVDNGGSRVRGSAEWITLAFDTDPTSGFATMSGQGAQAAVDGVATFPAINIDTVASGYSLRAGSPSLTPAVSTLFEITSPDPWPPALDAWQFRKKIVVPSRLPLAQIDDFPLLISNVDVDLRDHAAANGYDISFATASGAPLEHELELFDGADGTLVAWVKLPTLDTAIDTVIYLYYGQPGVTVDPSVTTVWSNGFQAVWHLGEPGSGIAGEFADSSGNGIDATGGGGLASAAPARVLAKIGKGQSLDGLDDFIATVPSLLNGRTSLSVTMWVNIRRNDNTTRPALAGQNNTMEMGFFWLDRINLWAVGMTTLCPGKPIESLCTPDFSLGNWLFLALSWDGTEIAMYVDGAEKHRVPLASLAPSAFTFNIGGGGIFDLSDNSLDGTVDEVRVATTDRPGEWFAIEHANQADPDLFYLLGFEELHP